MLRAGGFAVPINCNTAYWRQIFAQVPVGHYYGYYMATSVMHMCCFMVSSGMAIPSNHHRPITTQAAIHDRDLCTAARAYTRLACSNPLTQLLTLCCRSGFSPLLLLLVGAAVSLLFLLVLATVVATVLRCGGGFARGWWG